MGSFAQGSLIERTTSTTNSSGTTTLTLSSTSLQRFTGSLAQIIVLPDATTLLVGRYFIIENESNSDITVNFNGGSLAANIASGTQRSFELFGNSSSAGDWIIGNQLDIDGPLALHATRPAANTTLNIRSNQISSGAGNILSTAPIDDVINIYPDTSINMVFYAQAGGVSGGIVYTESGVFTRPSIPSNQYTRLVFAYVSTLNAINTKFSAASVTQGGLTNAGILFASIEGMPIGYVDLKSLGSWNFSTANSSSAIIENKDIVKFSAGTGTGGGDTSFKFQTISSNILTVKKGFLIVNDGRELYSPSDFTIDLTTIAAVDGSYYGYIDLASLPTTATYFNGRKLYLVTTSNIYFTTTSPDNYGVNLSRFIPLGIVQRTAGVWVNQQSTALRRHDNVVLGADASLEYSVPYTLVGNVGSVGQIKAGHLLDSNSFPTTITSTNISWYDLTNVSDGSTNARNLTANGSPLYTDTNILGIANCFAPDGVNDYLSSTASFFNPNAATSFAFGLWFKADNYSVGTQALVSNWGAANKSYKLQLNSGDIEFVISSNGTTEVTTVIYDSSIFPVLSGWNQFVVSYNPSGNLFSFYLNSNFLLSVSLSIFAGTSTFNLAAANGGSFFAGAMDEFFFINGNYLTQDAVSKLFCTKIVHNRSLTTTNQRWSAFVADSNTDIERQLFTNFTIDVTPNILYADFSDQLATTQIAYRMHNVGNVGLSKPIKSRTLVKTAAEIDALMPLTHYLYDVPTIKLQVDEGSSQFSTHNDASYFVASNTQIISSGTSLTSIIGGSTVVRFTYSVGGESINSRLLGSYIIVGSHPDADYSDLWSALAASSTVAGSRILVISDQTLSTAQVISANNVYIEFLPSIKIISTVAAGTALTFSGTGLITNNMTIQANGNANVISISGSGIYHNNFIVVVNGNITTITTFDSLSSRNKIEGNIQTSGGSFTNAIVDSSTSQTNVWIMSINSRIETFSGVAGPGSIPIGSIIPILRDSPITSGGYTIPLSGSVDSNGFMLCDGGTIPLGQTLIGITPNLSDGRYLRGSTFSGTIGGANTQSLVAANIPQVSTSYTPAGSVSGTTNIGHTHGSSSVSGSIGPDGIHGHSIQLQSRFSDTSGTNTGSALAAQNIGWPYGIGTDGGTGTHGHGFSLTAAGQSLGTTNVSLTSGTLNGTGVTITVGTASPTAVNNEPQYMNVRYLIRVK